MFMAMGACYMDDYGWICDFSYLGSLKSEKRRPFCRLEWSLWTAPIAPDGFASESLAVAVSPVRPGLICNSHQWGGEHISQQSQIQYAAIYNYIHIGIYHYIDIIMYIYK